MVADQEKIAQWLSGRSSSLHEAYIGAIHLLADTSVPGRAQLICHAGRDLCTGFQDLQSISKDRADTVPLLREIDSYWQREGLDAIGFFGTGGPEPVAELTASPEVTIPRHLMVLFQRLVEEHRRGSMNQEEQAAKLFMANDPTAANRPEVVQPLSREWVRLRRWFVRYAHFAVQQRTPD